MTKNLPASYSSTKAALLPAQFLLLYTHGQSRAAFEAAQYRKTLFGAGYLLKDP